jgi:hypothetical protein
MEEPTLGCYGIERLAAEPVDRELTPPGFDRKPDAPRRAVPPHSGMAPLA